jgi:hypothetical protein
MSEHDEVQGEALPEETQVETGETPEVVEQAESAPADPDEKSGENPAAHKPKRGVQERINELVRQREEAAREARLYREQLESMKAPQQPKGEPDISQFERYEDYLKALSAHEARQAIAAQQQSLAQMAQTREMEAKKRAFSERVAQFEAEDFQEVAFDPSLPVSDAMRDVILESDKGPALLYHLGQNRTEAARIAQMSPIQAARALGLLEAKLSLPQAKTISAAPPPIKPIGGSGEPPGIDPEKMTPEEYREWRFKRVNGRM